jgi:hypothetical protein
MACFAASAIKETTMSWHSYPFGAALAPEHVTADRTARDLLGQAADLPHYVGAASRNGALLQTLRQLLAHAPDDIELYLLADQAVVAGAALAQQRERVEALLTELARNPGLVIAATRQPHAPGGTLHAEGFEPLAYETVYGPECRIEDGWVYFYTEDQIRALLAAAICGPDPKPADDDEGESLQYVFGFLKSHAALLRTAAEAGLCVVYAEMNPHD